MAKRIVTLVALGMMMGLFPRHDACAQGRADAVRADTVRVSVLGVEAVRVTCGKKTVFIDAFADGIPEFEADKASLILVTHDDGDHFSAPKVAAAARAAGALVVGPPSIAYPLLVDEKLPPEQLAIVYPKLFKKPIVREIRGVRIKIFQTQHNGEWNPVHVSYLVELGGKKLFHTGDSSMIPEDDADLRNLDVLLHVFNTKDAAQISRLDAVREKLRPRYLVPIHLLHCSWTMTPEGFAREVEERGLKGFVVLGENDVLEVP